MTVRIMVFYGETPWITLGYSVKYEIVVIEIDIPVLARCQKVLFAADLTALRRSFFVPAKNPVKKKAC